MAETESTQSTSLLGHLRGAEGDHLTERSEGRKLPQLEPRALATPRELKTSPSGVLRGGCKGVAKGAQPHNRPHLAARRAGVPNLDGRRTHMPEGQPNNNTPKNPTTDLDDFIGLTIQ